MTTRRSPLIWIVALLLLFFIGGPALLYAYRSQSQRIPTVPLTQAITDIQNGSVDQILLENDCATLTFMLGSREQTFVGGSRDVLLQAVTEYNRAHPAKDIQMRVDNRYPFGQTLLSVVLGLLPLVFLISIVVFAAYAFARARAPDSYERLGRLADLRDRNVITEDEFQREKRRVLG
jgi:uncharacterized membrane protein